MEEPLEHDHAELGDLLGELRKVLKERDVVRSHATLDLFWARLAMHIRAEHLHLFPAILRALSDIPKDDTQRGPSRDEAQNTIEDLRHDHDFFMRELSRAMVLLRGLLSEPRREVAVAQLEGVDAMVAAIEARLAKHNRVEENGIYLWMKSLLSEVEQGELRKRVQMELAKMPPRFAEPLSSAEC